MGIIKNHEIGIPIKTTRIQWKVRPFFSWLIRLTDPFGTRMAHEANRHGRPRPETSSFGTRLFWAKHIPIGSRHGIFTQIYHINQLSVGKYTIHGSYGITNPQLLWLHENTLQPQRFALEKMQSISVKFSVTRTGFIIVFWHYTTCTCC